MLLETYHHQNVQWFSYVERQVPQLAAFVRSSSWRIDQQGFWLPFPSPFWNRRYVTCCLDCHPSWQSFLVVDFVDSVVVLLFVWRCFVADDVVLLFRRRPGFFRAKKKRLAKAEPTAATYLQSTYVQKNSTLFLCGLFYWRLPKRYKLNFGTVCVRYRQR